MRAFSFLRCRLVYVALPGLAPAGDSLSLASPRESKQREGEPGASSLRFATGTLRCSARAGSAETRPAGSDICASVSALSCATRLRTRQGMPKARWLACLAVLSSLVAVPRRADPGQVEHRRLPRRSRGHSHQGRLFFGDFLLAKQKKVTALPGAHPGNAAPATAQRSKEKARM